MTKTQRIAQALPECGLVVAIADAHSAADAASRIGAAAQLWSARAGAGADDAAEAMRCAVRARTHAERAEACTAADDAWTCARMAWGAAASAIEANARVNALIAEELAIL